MAKKLRKTVRLNMQEKKNLTKLKYYMKLQTISEVLRNCSMMMIRMYEDERINILMKNRHCATPEQLLYKLIEEHNQYELQRDVRRD